MNILTKN